MRSDADPRVQVPLRSGAACHTNRDAEWSDALRVVSAGAGAEDWDQATYRRRCIYEYRVKKGQPPLTAPWIPSVIRLSPNLRLLCFSLNLLSYSPKHTPIQAKASLYLIIESQHGGRARSTHRHYRCGYAFLFFTSHTGQWMLTFHRHGWLRDGPRFCQEGVQEHRCLRDGVKSRFCRRRHPDAAQRRACTRPVRMLEGDLRRGNKRSGDQHQA